MARIESGIHASQFSKVTKITLAVSGSIPKIVPTKGILNEVYLG